MEEATEGRADAKEMNVDAAAAAVFFLFFFLV